MLHYKDTTFCTYYADCARADTCPRPLTREIKEAANAWFRSWCSDPAKSAPVAIYMEKPGCWQK